MLTTEEWQVISTYLKVEPTGFADRLNMGYKKRKELKMAARFEA